MSAAFDTMDGDSQRTMTLARSLDLPIIDDIEHLLTHAADCCGPSTDDFGTFIGRAESVRRWLNGEPPVTCSEHAPGSAVQGSN